MAETFDTVTDEMQNLIEQSHVFFVATAPSDGGRVNLSPKGYDTFRVLEPNRVAYLDLTGSGTETIAHLRDNGRITFMFCAFEGGANIVRLYGAGRIVQADDPGFEELRAEFGNYRGVRSIIVADIDRTSTSCGWAVPFMDYVGERTKLADEYEEIDEAELVTYRADANRSSIDGLPALG